MTRNTLFKATSSETTPKIIKVLCFVFAIHGCPPLGRNARFIPFLSFSQSLQGVNTERNRENTPEISAECHSVHCVKHH